MPADFTLPPDTRSVGSGNPPADMNAVVDALTAMGVMSSVLDANYAGGAKGDGSTDDTAAIQAAATAAKSSGRPLLFPASSGAYIVSSPILVGGGSPGALQVIGEGWNSQIKLKNSSNCYLFDFGSSGSPQYTPGLVMRDLYLNCNGTNQTGSSGAVYARGAVWCLFDHLWIDSPLEAAIRFFQDGTGAYGHHNTVRACLVTGGSISGQYGVWLDHCDETVITENTFQNVGVTSDTYPGAVNDQSGLQAIIGNNFVGGTGIRVGGPGNRTRIIGNIFDGSSSGSGQVYAGNSGVVIADNYLYNILAGKDGVFVDNTDSAVIRDNQCTTLTNAAAQSGVHLSAACTNCIVEGNIMTVQGTGSYTAAGGIKIDSLTSGNTGTVVRDNRPYNPLGALATQPTVPGSTTPYSNANNADCTVYITAGSSTCAVAVGGTAMFTIASAGTGTARVPAGQSITLTYSNAPTWKWAGD